MTTPLICAKGLTKSFGSQAVLKALDWDIPSGSIVGLLGRNGAGKSTLIECLLGLRDAQSGSVALFGEDAGHMSEATKARIGYVPQTSEMFEWLTPRQLLAYFRVFYSHWNQDKVDGLMQRWALPWDKPVSKLSPGQKQRLSIIRALAHEPELLLLDEPVSSLDPAGRRDFLRELIDGVLDRNTTVVFSTHILSDLERVAMDVAILIDGKIAVQQPLDMLIEHTWRVTGMSAAISALPPARVLHRKSLPDGATALLAQFAPMHGADWQLASDLRLEKVGLEDLFIEMTQ